MASAVVTSSLSASESTPSTASKAPGILRSASMAPICSREMPWWASSRRSSKSVVELKGTSFDFERRRLCDTRPGLPGSSTWDGGSIWWSARSAAARAIPNFQKWDAEGEWE